MIDWEFVVICSILGALVGFGVGYLPDILLRKKFFFEIDFDRPRGESDCEEVKG